MCGRLHDNEVWSSFYPSQIWPGMYAHGRRIMCDYAMGQGRSHEFACGRRQESHQNIS